MRNLLITLFTLVSLYGQAQQYLYLKQGNEFPVKKYGINDRITFKTDLEDPWLHGIIKEIRPEHVIIGGVMYPLEAIVAVRTSEELLDLTSAALIAGGLLFTGIVVTNGLINNDNPIIKEGQVLLSTAMVAGGFIVRWISRKSYKAEDGWHWVTINLNEFNTSE